MTPFDLNRLTQRLAALAQRSVFLGTSSWKYPGWRGMLYDDARYVFRGKFSQDRFERLCLMEYAQAFRTVGVDGAYYQFPTAGYLENLMGQVPRDFRFSFKVTDEITIKKFAQLPRFGPRAGRLNENFLNTDLFGSAFLKPCEPYRENIALLMFEFSRFHPADFARGRDFVEALDRFLGGLPSGWHYGVELRNPQFLQPEYFDTLRRHRVTHIYNSWEGMPPIGEQMDLPGSQSTPEILGARFLLRPGRKYEEAVQRFSPYDRVQEPNEEGRQAGARLILQTAASGGQRQAFIYVNNRFEGNALQTIEAMIDLAGAA